MAKKFRRMMALAMALILCFAQMAMPASAKGNGKEYVQIIVNGSVAATHSGTEGDDGWLIRGTYGTPAVSVSGTTVTYSIGNQKNKTASITLPDGCTVGQYEASVTVSGTNSEGASYDNAIINITIKTMITPGGEEIPVTPDPVKTSVTVNHNYYTYDIYLGETVLDGSTSGTSSATEKASFTATPVTSYGGNEYTQTTAASALTITVNADASKNVINIDYLRTVDTTPAPVQTNVTVNHNYYTYDIYLDKTDLDGSTSGTEAALEKDLYTATPVTTYGGNTYTNTTDASALTITVVADASKNVININYLRTIDTTPAQTNVTVNHNYYTYDIYLDETVLDGSVSGIENATENDSFTATPVTSYGDNTYTQTTADSALTITVNADASKNVINIDYLRTIDTTPENYTPVLNVVKTADKASYEIGETITWTITVTNSSEYTAYNVSVIDTLVNGNWTIDELAPGASESFTATAEAEAAGTINNVAVASWTDGDEIPDEEEDETTSARDEETVEVEEPTPPPAPVDYEPVLNVTKTADKATYEVGKTITWTITVTNISEYTAYDVVISDAFTGNTWNIDALAPGASRSFIATTKTEAAGTVKNVAAAVWTDGDEIPDAEEDETKFARDEETVLVEEPTPPPTEPEVTEPEVTEPEVTEPEVTEPEVTEPEVTEPEVIEPVDFEPVLSITKVADKASYEAGETITWTITVKNNSAYTAYDIEVVDKVTYDSWTIDKLEPGQEMSFIVTMKTEAAGAVVNTAAAIWDDGDEIADEEEAEEITEVSVEATVTVNEPAPAPAPVPAEPDNVVIEEEEVPLAPAPVEPAAEEPADNNGIMVIDGYVEIIDEDVPLADVPQTGDSSILWAALSLVSGGMFVLNKKREDEE